MFCLSFLVAFPKKVKQKPNRKIKPPKKQSKKQTPEPSESEVPLYKPLEIGVKSTCAIKYSLFDGFQYQVDVCSWGQPGKVYAGGKSRAVRCLQTDKLSVVCFSIYHAFAQLNLVQDDIIRLLNQSVSFKFFDNKAQMSAGSKSDAPKYFYDSNEASDKISFAIIHEGKTSNGPDDVTTEERVTFETLSDEAQSMTGGVLSKLRGKPLGLHRKKLLDIIESLDDKILAAIELKQVGSKSSDRSTAKSQGKKTPKSARSKDSNAIVFSCTELLLDEIMIYHKKMKPAKQIEFVAVIVSAKDLMLDEIRQALFPFCVEIKHLHDLPLSNLSLTHIFLKYSLESAFTQETEKIEITQDNYQCIEFDYSKIFLINRMELPFSVFIEALQTGLFLIEFYGVQAATVDTNRDKNTSKKANNEGLDNKGKNSRNRPKSAKEKRSKKAPKNEKTSILLAVAYMNLCDMMKSTLWTDYNIHLTANLPPENWWNDRIYQQGSIIKAETKDKSEIGVPCFTQKELMECGTIIKVRLRNGDLIQPPLLQNILSYKEIMSRIIIVFYDNDTRNTIWDIVNIHNEICGDGSLSKQTSDSIISLRLDTASLNSQIIDMNYTSGFLINTLDKKFLMAEGLTNFQFSRILGVVSRLKNKKNVKIFFNSNFVFTQRLYPNSNKKLANIIELKKPLSTTMRLPYHVLKRKIPLLVLKAITKLERMLNCYTMLEVCVQKLFPRPEELSALEKELGIEYPKDDIGQVIIKESDLK